MENEACYLSHIFLLALIFFAQGAHLQNASLCYEYSSPCRNGADCTEIILADNVTSIKCLCRLGYTGSYCEVELIDLEPSICSSDPCQNGASCSETLAVDNTTSYHCYCVDGFSGTFCEVSDPPAVGCGPFTCPEQASCLEIDLYYLCTCPSNLSGPSCADNVDYDIPRIEYSSLTILKHENGTWNPYSKIVLGCTANGYRIEWRRNGLKWFNADSTRNESSTSKVTRLLMSYVAIDQGGTYTCVVLRQEATIMSDNVTVRTLTIPPDSIEPEGEEINSDKTLLSCVDWDVRLLNLATSITWCNLTPQTSAEYLQSTESFRQSLPNNTEEMPESNSSFASFQTDTLPAMTLSTPVISSTRQGESTPVISSTRQGESTPVISSTRQGESTPVISYTLQGESTPLISSRGQGESCDVLTTIPLSPAHTYVDLQGRLHLFEITRPETLQLQCILELPIGLLRKQFFLNFTGLNSNKSEYHSSDNSSWSSRIVFTSPTNVTFTENSTADLECVCAGCSGMNASEECDDSPVQTFWHEATGNLTLLPAGDKWNRHIRLPNIQPATNDKQWNVTCSCQKYSDSGPLQRFSIHVERTLKWAIEHVGVTSNQAKQIACIPSADNSLVQWFVNGALPNSGHKENRNLLQVSFKNQNLIVAQCFATSASGLQAISSTFFVYNQAATFSSIETTIPSTTPFVLASTVNFSKTLNCTFDLGRECGWVVISDSSVMEVDDLQQLHSDCESDSGHDHYLAASEHLYLSSSEWIKIIPDSTEAAMKFSVYSESSIKQVKVYSGRPTYTVPDEIFGQYFSNGSQCYWEDICVNIPRDTSMVLIKLYSQKSRSIAIDDILVFPGQQCDSHSEAESRVNYFAVLVSLSGLVVVVVFGVIFFLCRRRRRRRLRREGGQRGQQIQLTRNGLPKSMNVSVIAKPHRYTHFPHAQNDSTVRLRIHESIGEGNFGRVFRGEAKDIMVKGAWTDVAIKMCKEDATNSQREDLTKETELLSQIPKHNNIVTFLGSTVTSGVAMLIVEFVNGPNLLHFLRQQRPLPPSKQMQQRRRLSTAIANSQPGKPSQSADSSAQKETPDHSGSPNTDHQVSAETDSGDNSHLLSWQELASLALQVAKGMEHLAAFKIVHRDLAARNVLIDENRVCKICDFGLARLLPDDNIYERKSKGALPIRWMSPESLKQGVYTTKSDVWSYGIVVWEIITLGATPWPSLKAHEVMARILAHDMLPKPEHCSEDIYESMRRCWNASPNGRPTFSQIRSTWESMLEQDGDYLQMDHINYEMYSAIEATSSMTSLEEEDVGSGRAVKLHNRRELTEAAKSLCEDGGREEERVERQCRTEDVAMELCPV